LNLIGDTNLKNLKNLLQPNKNLTMLNLCNKYYQFLDGNKIADDSAKAIAKLLENNTSLTKLELGNKYNQYYRK
jgi:hypothetical protein